MDEPSRSVTLEPETVRTITDRDPEMEIFAVERVSEELMRTPLPRTIWAKLRVRQKLDSDDLKRTGVVLDVPNPPSADGAKWGKTNTTG